MKVYIAFFVGDDLYDVVGVYATLEGAMKAHPANWAYVDAGSLGGRWYCEPWEDREKSGWRNPDAQAIEEHTVIA